jgi:carboxylate-amine ligase
MDGLLTAGVISSIREIWWDCRPHPDFGTVELRMCDGITNLDEVAALAALAQSLVAWLLERHAAGEALPGAPEWVVRENKWLASRHGLDSAFIIDGTGRRSPAITLLDELVERLLPTARSLGCADELASVRALVARGPSYRRQRRILDQGGDLRDVVAALAHEHRHGPS